MQRTEWFKRKFPLMEDNGILPVIIERLAGTPARVEELTSGLDDQLLTMKPGDKWSIKEEIGHLSDLEPLWFGRLDDFINREPELAPADLTNRKTHEANHNETSFSTLLGNFQAGTRLACGQTNEPRRRSSAAHRASSTAKNTDAGDRPGLFCCRA
jgi:hypothetical protein